jgi:iron complex outermembrane receptor protein
MPKPIRFRRSFLLACSSVAAMHFAMSVAAQADDSNQQVASNDQIPSNSGKNDNGNSGAGNAWGGGVELVVVTGSRFNPNNAPAKASLDTTEPQTIITNNYIQDSQPQTADYVTILGIAPSMTGMSINGPGMSDGNVKNTLRGQPDGNFAMTYDGVPFGDTNGPTHHSESYFPSSTIGTIDVDRGPGNAGNLGAATYGGTINIFSEGLTDDFRARQTFTYGSWSTYNINTNLQSGNLDIIDNGPTRALANFQYTGSNGYLHDQSTKHDNELIKIEQDLGPDWSLTFLANRNGLQQIVSDVNGATPGQLIVSGKTVALQDTNSHRSDFTGFNSEHKETDLDYLRLRGKIGHTLIDDEFYTYAYVNRTVTSNNIEQTKADAIAGVTPLDYINNPSNTDLEGYTKLNAYRVWGNVFRMTDKFDVFDIPGEWRAGLWAEGQATQRGRVYFDETACLAAHCYPFHQATLYADTNEPSANGNVPAKTVGTVPLGTGYHEHTNWTQYEPFVEIELDVTPDLTITPGVKYVYWTHGIAPNSVEKGKPPTVYPSSSPDEFTTSRTLPFVTANYKIQENWSAYFQYAGGIYVPDITAFQFNKPIVEFPKAQTTTNYQFGTVFYADNFTADADVYYIDSDNTLQYIKGNGTNGCLNGDSCATNAGPVIYKGIEGEATYTFDEKQLGGALDGLAVFGNGSLNAALQHVNPTGPISTPHQTLGPAYQAQQAPFWTAAAGLIYKHNGWKLSLIDKLTGQQYEDTPNKRVDASGNLIWMVNASNQTVRNPAYHGGSYYKLPATNTLDFTGSYDFGDIVGADWELGGGVYNILGARDPLAVTINDSAPHAAGGDSSTNVTQYRLRPNSLDQYYFMPERSFQATIKARF